MSARDAFFVQSPEGVSIFFKNRHGKPIMRPTEKETFGQLIGVKTSPKLGIRVPMAVPDVMLAATITIS